MMKQNIGFETVPSVETLTLRQSSIVLPAPPIKHAYNNYMVYSRYCGSKYNYIIIYISYWTLKEFFLYTGMFTYFTTSNVTK